jgi:hypothetical protein
MHTGECVGTPSLCRERLEHGGWPDGQVAQANPDCPENGVANGGADRGRARGVSAVDERDVEFRHVADAQRRVAVEIRVLHLAFDELGSAR